MKKILATLMAAAVMLSQLSLLAEAAEGNPLVVSDKITSDINELRQREEELENKRLAQQAASKALVNYGKTTGKTNDLSFYINRKNLTKREYEAFKWSFIFAQFAHPLEDSLLNVFDQDFFQQMVSQDFDINSLRSTLIEKGLAASSDDNLVSNFDAELQTMMLQDTNFNELVEVMKSNYAVYQLWTKNGSELTFSSIISGNRPLYEAYYIYDTYAEITDGKSATELNHLLYAQDQVSDINKKYSDSVTIKGIASSQEENTQANAYTVPVLFYDSSTYLYMQTAVTIYMREHDIESLDELNAEFGDKPLVIDSYGNVCLQLNDGTCTIFIPNFGNTIFTASLAEDSASLISNLDLYNLWFVALYSKSTRSRTTIYPANFTVNATLEGAKSDHYSKYVPLGNSGTLSNTWILTESSNIAPTNNVKELFNDKETAAFSSNAKKLAESHDSWFSDLQKYSSDKSKTIYSPWNLHTSAFAPFTMQSSSDEDYYTNKHPIVQMDYGVKYGTSTANEYRTVYSHLADSLSSAKWRFSSATSSTISSRTIYSSFVSENVNDDTGLTVVNQLLNLATNIPPAQLIPDLRFCTNQDSSLADGSQRTYIFLPKSNVDLGQDMSAYKLSTEKGMFIAQYDAYFSSNMTEFYAYMKGATASYADADSFVELGTTVKLRNHNPANRSAIIGASDFELTVTADIWNTKEFWDFVSEVNSDAVGCKFNLSHSYVIYNSETQKYSKSADGECGENETIDETYYYDSSVINFELTVDSDSGGTATYTTKTAGDNIIYPVRFFFSLLCGDCDKKTFKNPSEFFELISDYANDCGITSSASDVAYILVNGHKYNGTDNLDGLSNIYFYDEYVYFLRNASATSGTIGCNNSSDFATATYYWDRHYLVQSYTNLAVYRYINTQYLVAKAAIDSYHEYLKQSFQTSLQYSFEKYMQDNPLKVVSLGKSYPAPFAYEYALQTESFEEWKTKHTAWTSVITDDTQLYYEYLADDTIVLYPFGWESSPYSYNIKLAAGAGDNIYTHANTGVATGTIENQQIRQKINVVQTILALQKNTDYQHNILKTTYTQRADENHVTKEELMDKANQFFDNPVSSLSYILTGFLYQVHETVATGDFGSIFSISYLTDTDAYRWIMNRYIALVTIAIAFVLFLKLIQFAMNKSKDFSHIGRSVVGILAMCMVPVVVFNSFIWAFDTTSAWAMKSTSDKILLAQINKYCSDVNNDGNVTAEITAFKQQFSSLKGTYDCLQFQQMTNYSLGTGPVYSTVPISDMIANLKYSTAYTSWYSNKTFIPVHQDLYKDSYFYFFYDYIKQEFLKYATEHDTISAEVLQAADSFEASRKNLKAGEANDAAKDVNAAENLFRTSRGAFRQMLTDTDFVYKNSVHESQEERYGGPHAADLAGYYIIFDNSYAGSGTAEITSLLQDSVYFRAYEDSDTMKISSDGLVSETWLNQNAIKDYVGQQMSAGKGLRSPFVLSNNYNIYTSGLDPYNSSFSTGVDARKIDARYQETAPIYTPFEKKLIEATEKTYDQTLAALNYLPGQMHDEAAITLMALIATFNLNEIMGYEPTAPVTQSVLLDDVVSTAFLTDLDAIGTETNTLYAMILQGDGIGKISLVVVLEIIICLSSIFRVLIILYITGASFIILMLRLLHKAPRTTELIYGIVGNVLALLFLHALTLFLVVIAIEWVANATSAIPGFVMDILMVAFSILVSFFLFRLIKNLIKDAINMGGSKIKAGVMKITDAIANVAGKFTSPKSEINAQIAEINAQNSETQRSLAEEIKDMQKMREERISVVSARLREAEAEAAEAEAENRREDEAIRQSKANELAEAEAKLRS